MENRKTTPRSGRPSAVIYVVIRGFDEIRRRWMPCTPSLPYEPPFVEMNVAVAVDVPSPC